MQYTLIMISVCTIELSQNILLNKKNYAILKTN